jgi:hypothetical protein
MRETRSTSSLTLIEETLVDDEEEVDEVDDPDPLALFAFAAICAL